MLLSHPLFSISSLHHYVYSSNNRALPLNLLHNLRSECALLRKTHLRGKGRVWHPLARIPSIRLFQHTIDLFERQTLGFRNEEVGVDEAADTKGTPNEEDLGAEVALVSVDHVGGDDADNLYRALAIAGQVD